jgi:hypothetical protein
VHRERWPANTRAITPVNTPVRAAAQTALGPEFEALKSRLEHCRDMIERTLQLLSADAQAVERDTDMFDHGPQGAD